MGLERMDEGRRIDLVRLLESQHQTEELGIAGDEGVVVAGGGARSRRRDRRHPRHRLDVVEGEVQVLEGEAAELAHEAGDELIGGYGERVPLGPGAAVVRTDLDAEEAIGIEPQPALTQRAQGVDRISMTSRCAAKVGSSQLNVGCPSLK